MIIQDMNSDDDSVPIPLTTLQAICREEISLSEFSKLRIFNTLFSRDGIPKELKGQFWRRLAGIQEITDLERES